MRTIVTRGVALAAALSLVATGLTAAAGRPVTDDGAINDAADVHGVANQQHGGTGGHLPATGSNVSLVSKLRLTTSEGRIADVGVLKGYAYLTAYRQDACSGPEGGEPDGGTFIVDISNPANPTQVGFLAGFQDTFTGEGSQAVSIDTPRFTGDLFVQNNESCGKNSKGGVSLFDVTNPSKPMKLVENFGDFTTNGAINNPHDANDIHSAFAWDAGDRAFVVLVDDEEGADVDIFDITDPRHPALVGEWDLNEAFPGITDPVLGSGSSFLHDAVVKPIDGRQVMLLSYWDGGYVTLDVTDPANPTYIADTDFTNPDPQALENGNGSVLPEGNAHYAEFTKNNDYIVGADEDFAPFALVARNTTDSSTFEATQGNGTPQIGAGSPMAGQTIFVGRACNGDPAVPTGGSSRIALVERGLCTFTEKVANVEAAGGYAGVIIFNREGPDACSDLLQMAVTGGIPAIFVNRPTGFDLLNVTGYDEAACRAAPAAANPPTAIGTLGDSVSVASIFDGWGYVHLYRNGGGKLTELDTWALPESQNQALAAGSGDLSVHEVATSPTRNDLVYVSHYAGGFRVLRIVGDSLVEAGRFIDEGGNNIWGVQVFQSGGREYVAASDRDYGLYIFEYTGP